VQIHISPADGVPIYLQIVNQVKYLVACGRLSAGEELPPIRVLAERLVVNPNTVARAYRELEQAGAVETRGRHGTFVALSSDMTERAAQEAAAAYVARLRSLGIPDADVVSYVKAAVTAG